MTRRVLVTRPQPGADETAARLSDLGFTPVVLPLTRIVPVGLPETGTFSRFDALVVTSVNAVRHTPPDIVTRLREKPVFAVGEASALAARHAGFRNVIAGPGTAADLAPLIAATLPRQSRVVHLAAVERTAGFAEQLAASGIALQIAEIYRAEKISYAPDFLKTLFGDETLWGAVSLSERAADFLAELIQEAGVLQAFERTMFFCISEKVARPLRAMAVGTVLVSAAPTGDSVLRLLLSQR